MKAGFSNTKTFLLACLLMSSLAVTAQDIKLTSIDTSWSSWSLAPRSIFYSYSPLFNYIYHSPDEKDNERYSKSKALINQLPTSKNYERYYQLACSLWNLEKTKDAEKMFLNIVQSGIGVYSSTYWHSSDIPGDTTVNSYGYGSYSSNYKNYACIYLCKIYVEQKKYDKALAFLNTAIKKYKVAYTCGTGYHMQQDEYTFLYAACYAGLNRNKEALDILLPGCLERDDEIIIKVIKRRYTREQINNYLKEAEASLTCTIDTFPSYSYITRYGEKNESEDTIMYYSGQGTMKLFGHKIELPRPDLQDGEIATKEHFLNAFWESPFYKMLSEYSGSSMIAPKPPVSN